MGSGVAYIGGGGVTKIGFALFPHEALISNDNLIRLIKNAVHPCAVHLLGVFCTTASH